MKQHKLATSTNRLILAALLLFFLCPSKCQEVSIWTFQSCRISTAEDGSFLLCEEQADCTSENVGSYINCTQYTYRTISNMSVCISTCCFDLDPVPETLTYPTIVECSDQALWRWKRWILMVVFATVGSVGFVVALCAFLIFGFVTNPYTGSRTYVGCCCCKTVPDFQADREKYLSK